MRHFLFRSVAGGGSLVSLVSVALMASAAIPVNTANAATIHVMNCNDSGVGSLRGSVSSALSGDTIDLTQLRCSRIVLTSGQVVILQPDMTLIGPGRSRLTLDGNHANRIFLHSGGGTLMVKSMTIANGYFSLPPRARYGPPYGGCIKSDSNVELNAIDLHDCLVEEVPYAFADAPGGGGVYAQYSLRLINSNIFSNIARNGRGGGAQSQQLVVYRSHIYNNNANHGGGLAGDDSSLSYSTVDNNTATAIDEFDVASGGGISTFGKLSFDKSTVSNNRVLGGQSDYSQGGGADGGGNVYVYDSTFSGNVAAYGSALLGVNVSIANSTIAFNQENQTTYPESFGAVRGYAYAINSSIIARNRWNNDQANDVSSGIYVHGAHNLIEKSATPLPADTLSINPLLAALANNGGPTRTHALLNGSPAIDRGSNPRHRLYDQRGPGFVRVKGLAPDIGAFEH